MKVIENPVRQIENADDLFDIQLVIVALLKSLKNIYEYNKNGQIMQGAWKHS